MDIPKEWIREDRTLDHVDPVVIWPPYVRTYKGYDPRSVCLDGVFSIDELEAIIAYIKNLGQ